MQVIEPRGVSRRRHQFQARTQDPSDEPLCRLLAAERVPSTPHEQRRGVDRREQLVGQDDVPQAVQRRDEGSSERQLVAEGIGLAQEREVALESSRVMRPSSRLGP